MMEPVYNLENLFAQLGLPNDPEAIEAFMAKHCLTEDNKLHQASFWTPPQAKFLIEEWIRDADWAPIIDELNVRMRC